MTQASDIFLFSLCRRSKAEEGDSRSRLDASIARLDSTRLEVYSERMCVCDSARQSRAPLLRVGLTSRSVNITRHYTVSELVGARLRLASQIGWPLPSGKDNARDLTWTTLRTRGSASIFDLISNDVHSNLTAMESDRVSSGNSRTHAISLCIIHEINARV